VVQGQSRWYSRDREEFYPLHRAWCSKFAPLIEPTVMPFYGAKARSVPEHLKLRFDSTRSAST
jgi:hypothetical protein